MLTVQESPGVPEGNEAAAGHVPLSTEGAEGQSPAHGCREEVQVRGDRHSTKHHRVIQRLTPAPLHGLFFSYIPPVV